MIGTNRTNKVLMKIFLLGLILAPYAFVVPNLFAQTYDFDEGIEVLAEGLISKRGEVLRNKEIAVFGIIESRSKKKLEISSHIEDGIVDVLVNEGYTVIERRRIDDVIKKEIKKSADLWFDEAQVAQFGKLVGADIVVTGRYIRWGQSILKVSIRAINISDGKILAANKVKILTDRIAELLIPEENEKDLKKAKHRINERTKITKKNGEARAKKKSRMGPVELQPHEFELSVSSRVNKYERKKNVLDDDPETRWLARTNRNEFIRFDFHREHIVTKIVLKQPWHEPPEIHRYSWPKDVQIIFSDNSSMMFSLIEDATKAQTLPIQNKRTRSIKMLIKSNYLGDRKKNVTGFSKVRIYSK